MRYQSAYYDIAILYVSSLHGVERSRDTLDGESGHMAMRHNDWGIESKRRPQEYSAIFRADLVIIS
jgi:hypothetical protein